MILCVAVLVGCGPSGDNNSNNSNIAAPPDILGLRVVERPQKIKDLMAARREQDSATPKLKIIEPAANASVNGSTVKVKLELSGDLKGYKPGMDEATHTGNHIHVILDNQPYEAYYNLDQPFELRNVSDGEHTLRVFPSRPWHESYKNEDAFQMVKFTVKNGGADVNKPATTSDGQQMSNAAGPASEGKEMAPSTAGAVELYRALLTYSRPKGEYKGEDGKAVMIDFWLSNAAIEPNAEAKNSYEIVRVRYSIDGGGPKYIETWEPIWIAGLTDGKHTVKLEVVDEDGNPIDNGGYNSTTREITVTK